MSGPYNPTPGLDLDESRQNAVWVSILLPYTLALIAVVLRFTSRRIARKGSWFDDWLMALAMMLATGILAGTTTSIREGLGLHIWVFPIQDIAGRAQNILLGLFELDNMYYACYGLAKMSLLALYYRAFHNRIIRRIIYIFILAVVLWIGVAICLTVLECEPVSGFWLDPLEAYCPIPRIPLHLYLSIVSVIMNFMILFLPIPLFLDPEHTKLHRLILFFLFGFGLFVCIVSIIRTLSITYTDITSVDLFWNLANVWAWTAVEVQMAIVAANLPTLGHVFARFVPSLESDSLSPRHTGNSPLPRMRGSEKSPVQQVDRSTNSRILSLNKPLPPLNTNVDRYANEKGDWADTPQPLPEREPVRNVDHGIAEWEFVPDRPVVDPRAAQYAHPGTPVAGRWNRMSGMSAIVGGKQMRQEPQHDSSHSQTLVTQQSPRYNTDSYGSDAGLLPSQYQNRSSSNIAARMSDERPAPPPAALGAARGHARPADGGHSHPLRSSPSSSDSSMLYGGRDQGGRRSWYRRGTATTPEYDSSEDEALRRAGGSRYGKGSMHSRSQSSGAALSHYQTPYSLRYSAYGYGDNIKKEPKPPLRPRNPRRVTVQSVEAYRPSASTPETVAATEVTVTRAGPTSGTTPTLLQAQFGHGTVPASAARAATGSDGPTAATGGPVAPLIIGRPATAGAVSTGPASAPAVPNPDSIPRSVPFSSAPDPREPLSAPPTGAAPASTQRSSPHAGASIGHRSRGSLEEAEFATAQLSALTQSPQFRNSQSDPQLFDDAEEQGRHNNIPELYAHPPTAEGFGFSFREPETELPPIDDNTRPHEGRLRLPIRAPAPALEPQHHFPGGIHVIREVSVSNERLSEIRGRERLEMETELERSRQESEGE